MMDQSAIYPNLSWNLFAVYNDNATGAFENMCRDLFFCEYLHEMRNPHSDHNNPGVEVLPIKEPIRDDGLAPANIELELVTDKDIFTLLRKNKRVKEEQVRVVGELREVLWQKILS